MEVRYSDQEPWWPGSPGPSIFLAGPTPRQPDVPSWRPEALRILKDFDVELTALVPERSDVDYMGSYMYQVEWEYVSLANATCICIWVPRDMATMPALTTNVEFGYWLAKSPARVIYGRPEFSPHTKYLDWMFERDTGRKPFSTLASTLTACIERIQNV